MIIINVGSSSSENRSVESERLDYAARRIDRGKFPARSHTHSPRRAPESSNSEFRREAPESNTHEARRISQSKLGARRTTDKHRKVPGSGKEREPQRNRVFVNTESPGRHWTIGINEPKALRLVVSSSESDFFDVVESPCSDSGSPSRSR